MPSPQRILLFETSGLLSTLQQFEDAYATRHQPTRATRFLEQLLQPGESGIPAIADRIVIPDHVFYELSGILPICFPEMLRQLAAAKASGDPHRLARVVDLYALASPRGEVHDAAGQQKNHIRVLLYFLADHPESLMMTTTGAEYSKRLKADYAVLSSTDVSAMMQYRPTFADAFTHLNGSFNASSLRVHAGQLMMMGLISEREYHDRMERPEKPSSRQQRFYQASELVAKLERPAAANGMTLPQALRDYVRQDTALQESAKTAGYVTLGFFESFPAVLRLSLTGYHGAESPADAPSDRALVRQAIGASRLLMEHYIYGGIIPADNAALLATADVLGLDVSGLTPQTGSDRIRDRLIPQGFYEISPTLAQLHAIQQRLSAASYDLHQLNSFVAAIPSAEKAQGKAFQDACHNPQINLAQKSELKIPQVGTPYEKVFGDALLNGSISWDMFWRLVQATDGLNRRFGGMRGTENGDILVAPGADAESTRIFIAQEGFVGRTGVTRYGFLAQDQAVLNIGGKPTNYYTMSVRELFDRCHSGLSNRALSTKLYRVFETMLYRPVIHHAVALRNEALAILGEDRLVQLEKDFANRHARKSLEVQPPYRSLFSALHTNSRILRKNLGEVATLESAAALLQAYPQADVWLINHDSDLYPTADRQGNIVLEDAVIRQHAGLNAAIRTLNAQVAGHSKLHFVPTNHFIDGLYRLQQLPVPKAYDHVRAKPFIAAHPAKSWQRLVDRTLELDRQR